MGQSGAGKSTLLNRIVPELDLETAEISESLGRGKHTTRHVELLTLYDGLVADTLIQLNRFLKSIVDNCPNSFQNFSIGTPMSFS